MAITATTLANLADPNYASKEAAARAADAKDASGSGGFSSLFFNMPGRAAHAGERDDPLALVMAPPPDETPEERVLRLAREDEARRISEAIDESLKQERQQLKRRKVVKLLLLGQSESGVCFDLSFLYSVR